MSNPTVSTLLGGLFPDIAFGQLGHNIGVRDLSPSCYKLEGTVPTCFLVVVKGVTRLRPGYYIMQIAKLVHEATKEKNINTVVTPLYIGFDTCVLLVNLPYYELDERPSTDYMKAMWTEAARKTLAYVCERKPLEVHFAVLNRDGREMLSDILRKMQNDEGFLHTSIVTVKTPKPPVFDIKQLADGTRIEDGPHENQCFCDTSQLASFMLVFKGDN